MVKSIRLCLHIHLFSPLCGMNLLLTTRGASAEVRTQDTHLKRVVLYLLSYGRIFVILLSLLFNY